MPTLRLRFPILVIAGALLFGACNLMNKAEGPDDKAIVTDVRARLFQDPVLKTRDIRVDSDRGTVTLTGSVSSELEKAAVERLASLAPGVKQVVDQLAVSAPPAAQAPATASPVETAAAASPEPHHTARPARRSRTYADAPAPSEPAPSSAFPAAPPKPVETAAAPAAAPSPPPPPPPPVRITVPSGTVVTVRMIDSVDSARNRPGEEFAASLNSPVVAGDRVVFPQGSDARVRLVQAKESGHFKGSSELELELVSLSANGTTYNVQSGYYDVHGTSRGKRTAETVGGGAGLGAIIGAIAGGRKGAAIGAGAGAAAGGGIQAVTRGQQVKVPSETKIDFTLKSPLTVTMKP